MEQDLTLARMLLPTLTPTRNEEFARQKNLLLAQDGRVSVHYAPFDHIVRTARLVILGITPGLTQAVNAVNAAVEARDAGLPIEAVLEKAKMTASFSGGATRANLVAMLDAIGVARRFGLTSAAELFRPGSTDVHFTSALRYPVLVDGKNYNGTPHMLKTPILRRMVETWLAEEARLLPDALWLPLGAKAEAAAAHLVQAGLLRGSRVLAGMPHPSGANAERVAVFLGRKRPEDASPRTRPGPLIEAFARLSEQMATREGESA
ncbi:uracil-DNA glycosylase family protein [Oceanicella actignis]|uniref:Uracil DNA glycosylase superfamily protein n=1 Tax=Oceanicella actignis TaxID=1189325 RepID=A0A1M7SCG2_9RHOB|nr:uracil-DNA glycosylase family protein [Oceanicella actignis]SET26167.1 Uracil DNA glycosylase superfamily protein [Oceanicella actignis]SHN56197.1 Uracil DNA glycosylase superfamily protein [Oceanicella actignis]